jgi:hypothetical protein
MALTPGQGLAVLLIFIFLIISALLALAKWKLTQFVAAVMERHGAYGFGSSQSRSDGNDGLEAQEGHYEGSSSTSLQSVSSLSSDSSES